MVLHENKDGSIIMRLNIRGNLIVETFLNYQEYKKYISQIK